MSSTLSIDTLENIVRLVTSRDFIIVAILSFMLYLLCIRLPRRIKRSIIPRMRMNRTILIIVLEALCTICAHYGYEDEDTELSAVFRIHYESIKKILDDLKAIIKEEEKKNGDVSDE